jgi:type IV pilus assembly protein PilW
MNATGYRVTRRQHGLSLVELLVAMTIGLVLIGGAVYVYTQSRNSFGVNESVARLQETARYAMSVIEPDVRMGGFWGLMNDSELVVGRAAVAEGASALVSHTCGNNYAVDLFNSVEGTDADYTLTCEAGPDASGTVVAETDTLTVRRASTNATAPAANRLQLWSSRTLGRLFSDGTAPGPLAPNGQVNDILVNTYYVSQDSDTQGGIPSLRRQQLVGLGYQDQEIVTGVEDLQVQIGVDPNGVIGEATRYVDPGAVLPVGAQAVSVRVWILVRAENAEVGFTDDRTYTLGNRVYQPNDGFRRVLITRTIQLRNSLG